MQLLWRMNPGRQRPHLTNRNSFWEQVCPAGGCVLVHSPVLYTNRTGEENFCTWITPLLTSGRLCLHVLKLCLSDGVDKMWCDLSNVSHDLETRSLAGVCDSVEVIATESEPPAAAPCSLLQFVARTFRRNCRRLECLNLFASNSRTCTDLFCPCPPAQWAASFKDIFKQSPCFGHTGCKCHVRRPCGRFQEGRSAYIAGFLPVLCTSVVSSPHFKHFHCSKCGRLSQSAAELSSAERLKNLWITKFNSGSSEEDTSDQNFDVKEGPALCATGGPDDQADSQTKKRAVCVPRHDVLFHRK